MGRPSHYSLDIVTRCRSLLQHLMPHVQKGLPDDKKFGGSLTTTFLLAMANPMIALPVERIFKPDDGKDVVADDRALNAGLSDEVNKVFDGKTKLKESAFFVQADWRLVRNVKPFNIAQWGSEEIFEQLAGEAAKNAAAEETAKFMMIHLRNAIAHGGVVYLDKDGRLNEDTAAMLGFVSAKIDWKTQKLEGLHISRVGEPDFHKFLLAWSDWIEKSGVSAAIDSSPAIAA
jgi:hypothetical protein